MKAVFRLILFAIIGIPMLAFAFFNRSSVDVTVAPEGLALPIDPVLHLPLFLVAFAFLLLGAVLGGIAAWAGQGKHRRAARLARAEVVQLRAKVADTIPDGR